MNIKIFTICLILFSSQTFAEECQGNDSRKWMDCNGSKLFGSGELHVGEYKNGKMHGLGTLTFSDGRKNSGQWKNGEYVGK